MYNGFTITASTATLPVSVSDMKDYLKVSTTADDTLIEALIKAAARYLENYLGRALLTKTIVEKHDYFPTGTAPIELRIAPVASITSVVYLDTDGTTSTTWNTSNYALDNSSSLGKGRLILKQSAFYPSVAQQLAAVTITYQAGYGGVVTAIPEEILTGIKLLTAEFYQNREPRVKQLPTTVEHVVQPYRIEPGC
jgi:uncharacterized phiE125 gp8 family phage protein